MPCGNQRRVCVIAAGTSWAAASISRSSENCMPICVCPRLDVDVMLSMPAIVETCFSSGVATVAAIVVGLAPGSTAVTVSVGKSTFGRSLTGNCRYATMPKKRIAIMTSVVMMGRLMNSVVKLMPASPSAARGELCRGPLGRPGQPRRQPAQPRLRVVEVGVEHGRDEARHHLGEGEPAHDRNPQRPSQRRASPKTARYGQCAADLAH